MYALNSYIHYAGGAAQLFVDSVPIQKVVEQYGTPTYVYSLKRCNDRFQQITAAYSAKVPHVHIHFSLKSNACFAIVKSLVRAGSGIDCVSGGEVFKALRCGCDPSKIVFAGVGKSKEEIDFAVKNHVGWFNAENEAELDLIESAAAAANGTSPTKVALRINPDVHAHTAHPGLATGHGGAKFGISEEAVHRILSHPQKYPHLDICGIHVHIGSSLKDVTEVQKAVTIARTMVQAYPAIKSLNIGGGIPANYDGTPIPSERDFADLVGPMIPPFELHLEPGRSIVGESGVLVARILYTKERSGVRMLIVDASMCELVRPAMYGSHHGVVPLEQRRKSDECLKKYMIAGPVCETTDVLAHDVELSEEEAQPGRYVVILTAGAYGTTMASNYNAHPLPAEVVVDASGTTYRLARRRQTFEDLIQCEQDV